MANYSDPLGLLYGGVDYFGSAQPQQGRGLLQLTPQEIERMAAAQSPAFGVFPQMQPYRSQQDITASANVPVDVARGRVAGTLGLFGDVFNQPIPMVRPLQLLSQTMTGQQKYPDTEYFLENLPLKSDTPIGDVAGRIGSFAPINPMPALKGAQKLGGLLGEEMATRLSTGRPILPSLLAEPQTAMFAVNPAEQATTSGLLQAEVSPLGFYSAVEQQALKIPRKQGTGESFLNDLLKGQDVKKYEIEAMGLDTYLKGKPNVTRQEVQDFIANNRVNVQEVELSGEGNKSRVFSEFNPAIEKYAVYGPDLSFHGTFNTAQEADNFVNNYNAQIPYGPSIYDKYQMPGGENYREILLTLPFKEPAMPKGYEVTSMQYDDGTVRYFANTPTTRSSGYKTEEDAQAMLQRMVSGLKGFRENLSAYESSHWNEPNVLAHLRVNDRIDAEGKKMLFIEEVQSDWHQAGREKGYKTKESLEKWYNQNKLDNDPDFADLNSEQRSVIERNRSAGMGGDNAVPDAPFKDTWYQLALKRAIKEAVDKGYDRIGLTTGAQQAARYDLSKQVDELFYKKNEDGTYRLSAQAGGRGNMLGESISESKLPDYVGKEIATKIVENAGKDVNLGGQGSVSQPKDIWKGLSGIDLKVGGEGMKKYYDEIYPNFLNKYGKKYGAQIKETQIPTGRGDVGGVPSMYPNKETVRYLDITPEMRKAVKGGQPLAAVEGMTGLLA